MQECLLGGLQSLTDAELPILTSDFYSKHMLPAKPEGAEPLSIACGSKPPSVSAEHAGLAPGWRKVATAGVYLAGVSVDIKKSSYKKLSKLLSTFEKKVCTFGRAAPGLQTRPGQGSSCVHGK